MCYEYVNACRERKHNRDPENGSEPQPWIYIVCTLQTAYCTLYTAQAPYQGYIELEEKKTK